MTIKRNVKENNINRKMCKKIFIQRNVVKITTNIDIIFLEDRFNKFNVKNKKRLHDGFLMQIVATGLEQSIGFKYNAFTE